MYNLCIANLSPEAAQSSILRLALTDGHLHSATARVVAYNLVALGLQIMSATLQQPPQKPLTLSHDS